MTEKFNIGDQVSSVKSWKQYALNHVTSGPRPLELEEYQ